jgi:hypothetical protein
MLLIRCSQRTIQQFRCVVLSEQSCDSLMDPVGRANLEHPSAADHLQDIIGLCSNRVKNKNKRFILFISFNSWWRATTNPSQHARRHQFRVRHIPRSCRILSVDAFPSNETTIRKDRGAIMQAWRTFHNYLHITNETMDHAQGLRDSHPSLILSQSIQSL